MSGSASEKLEIPKKTREHAPGWTVVEKRKISKQGSSRCMMGRTCHEAKMHHNLQINVKLMFLHTFQNIMESNKSYISNIQHNPKHIIHSEYKI